MNFFIVDDDPAVRAMLVEIIEDEELGKVVGEAESGVEIDSDLLQMKNVDILLIDHLMPRKDGLDTIRDLKGFRGEIVMISQVSAHKVREEAYRLGIYNYIMKPIIRSEVERVLSNLIKMVRQERKIRRILGDREKDNGLNPLIRAGIEELKALKIYGVSGSQELLDLLLLLEQHEKEYGIFHEIPNLKKLYEQLARKRLGQDADSVQINRKVKKIERRLGRAIERSYDHFSAMLADDYMYHISLENASRYFDYHGIRNRSVRIKKFLMVFYQEAKQLRDRLQQQ
ncbi:MAG: response regulator [Thermoactinomyces sp.]